MRGNGGCEGAAFEAQEAMNSIFGEFSKRLCVTALHQYVSWSRQQGQFLVFI